LRIIKLTHPTAQLLIKQSLMRVYFGEKMLQKETIEVILTGFSTKAGKQNTR